MSEPQSTRSRDEVRVTLRQEAPAQTLTDVLTRYHLVDLSLTLDDRLPCAWPGNVAFQHKVHNWYAPVTEGPQPISSRSSFYTCWFTVDEHAGTHFDAPPHFIPPPDTALPHASEWGSQYGDKVPLEELQGPAVVVDVRPLLPHAHRGTSPLIDPQFLTEWERRHGEFKQGEAVLLFSGWDRYHTSGSNGRKYVDGPILFADEPGWPAPSAEAVEHLYDKGIRLLGTDAPSIGAAHEGASMHYAGLERGMRYVESLANLAVLPVRGSYFIFMPLKIAQSSGACGRAMAFVPDEVE